MNTAPAACAQMCYDIQGKCNNYVNLNSVFQPALKRITAYYSAIISQNCPGDPTASCLGGAAPFWVNAIKPLYNTVSAPPFLAILQRLAPVDGCGSQGVVALMNTYFTTLSGFNPTLLYTQTIPQVE